MRTVVAFASLLPVFQTIDYGSLLDRFECY
jgi:hypothetical protein